METALSDFHDERAQSFINYGPFYRRKVRLGGQRSRTISWLSLDLADLMKVENARLNDFTDRGGKNQGFTNSL